MRIFDRIRGPRLGTKLALLGIALMVVPFFSYRQLVQMEQLLITIQSQALLLNARNISTLFNGREDLFDELPVTAEQFEPLYAHPLEATIRMDGALEDWPLELHDEQLSFQSARSSGDGDFDLLLGEREGQLHAYMKIYDDGLVYRDTEYLRLDNADHLRVNFIPQDGDEGRVSLVIEESGAITGFAMDEDWRFAATGDADNRIQGFATETQDGLALEFRFPLDLLGSRRLFGISYVDVDDDVSREITGLTQTLPKADKQGFNLVVLQTPEVRNIIQGLGYAGARILVIDNQKRVRAEVGDLPPSLLPTDQSWIDQIENIFASLRPFLHFIVMGEQYAANDEPPPFEQAGDVAIGESLSGEPISMRSRLTESQEIILAAYPIVSAEAVLGTVVVEQNIDDILSFQRSALEEVITVSLISLLIVLGALLIFAGRLAWRIRNLRREANAAIDPYGRLRTGELKNEMEAGDEIGDLARSVSSMLSRLHRHNTFLESMPRTLRHEINNPLNTLSTSLQNLEESENNLVDNKYLESAKRGVNRIGSIVQNLADAANLEDSLDAEELELIDLNQLLENYVANCGIVHEGTRFDFRGAGGPALAYVSDFRIEQLLDKIIDNAVDFHRSDSAIRVQIDKHVDHLQITVANRGPLLPLEVENSVFDSMVSHRSAGNRLHFGLGLYVVRVIAEHHGGFVRALNLPDNSGVAVMVQLPLAQPERSIKTDTLKTEPNEGAIEPSVSAG